MAITINGTTGITTPEVTLDNSTADGGQVVLKSSGYSNWNLDNYSGRFRGYYGSTEYFTVDASGNMGIGTSSPACKTDVTGTIRTTSYTTPASGVGVEILYGAVANRGDIYAYDRGAAAYKDLLIGGLNMYLYAGGSERARIDSSGNLLVGATSFNRTDGRLRVRGASGVTATAVFDCDTTANFGQLYLANPNGTIGSITTSGSAAAFNTSSDYRLKHDIQPMTGALAKVAALKPCIYKWNVDGSNGEGFIAHELAEVVPQCVTGEKDAVDADGNPVYQGIDTSFLVATLTAAIQEQQALITQLQADVAALKGQQA